MLDAIISGVKRLFADFKFWATILPWQKGLRIRFGKHTKILTPGIHFKIPFVDEIYYLSLRLRTISTAKQDLTSLDKKTVTLNIHIAYEIEDPLLLMQTLYRPGQTIADLAQAAAAEYITNISTENLNISALEEAIAKTLNLDQYGLKCKRCYLGNFVITKSYRIIGDMEGAGLWDNVAKQFQGDPDD